MPETKTTLVSSDPNRGVYRQEDNVPIFTTKASAKPPPNSDKHLVIFEWELDDDGEFYLHHDVYKTEWLLEYRFACGLRYAHPLCVYFNEAIGKEKHSSFKTGQIAEKSDSGWSIVMYKDRHGLNTFVQRLLCILQNLDDTSHHEVVKRMCEQVRRCIGDYVG